MTTAHEPLFGLATGTRTRELSWPFGRLGTVLRTADEVREAYAQHRRARWIATDSTALKVLLGLEPRDTWHRLLLLEHAGTARREILHALFRVVIAPDDRVRLLAPEEMVRAARLGPHGPMRLTSSRAVGRKPSALVSIPMESPVRIERRTPGSARGGRKLRGETRG